MHKKRILTALIALPLLILSILKGGAFVFFCLICLASILSLREYFRITNSGDDLSDLIKSINKQEEKEFDSKVVSDYKSQFQFFLALALLFLLFDFFIFERKSKLTFSFKSLKLTKNE